MYLNSFAILKRCYKKFILRMPVQLEKVEKKMNNGSGLFYDVISKS